MIEQLDQESIFQTQSDDSTGSAKDAFGCCSRYRECSDAGTCLIPDRDYSKDCIYRKRLSEGRCFYSKNAEGFDRNRYARLRKQVNALHPAAHAVLDELIIRFCDLNRGTQSQIIRSADVLLISDLGLFDFRPLGSAFPKLCSFRGYLEPKFKECPQFQRSDTIRMSAVKSLRKKAEAAGKRGDADEEKRLRKELKDTEDNGKFMQNWLNNDEDGIVLRDIWAAPYQFVLQRSDQRMYVEELFRDTLNQSPDCDTRIFKPNPLVTDKLCTFSVWVDEMSRCVRLSRGYTEDEKKQKLEEIMAEKESYPKEPVYKYPFNGEMFVITGILSKMSREEAFIEIRKRGGRTSDNPVNSMDILILGNQVWSEMNHGLASRKVVKAVELGAKVISEDEFYEMIGALDTPGEA